MVTEFHFCTSVLSLSSVLVSAPRKRSVPAPSRQAEQITTLPVLKWDPGRRTLLHSEGRPQARFLGPIPGPLPHCASITAHVASVHRGQLLGAEQEAAAGRTPWSCPSAEQRSITWGWGPELIPMVCRGNAGRERSRAFMPLIPPSSWLPGFYSIML